jgi:cytochrome c2
VPRATPTPASRCTRRAARPAIRWTTTAWVRRTAASSGAGQRSPLVWDEASLERWLADPEKLAPGQRMGVDVPDAKDRADLIAYLKKMSAAGK